MRITTKQFCERFILLFYIIENHFFYLVPVSNTIIKYILFAMCLFCYGFVIVCINDKFDSMSVMYKRYILFWIPLFLLIQYIFVSQKYNATLTDFFKGAYHYCFIFISPLFYYIFQKDKSCIPFFNKITKVISINLFLHIINSVVYNISHKSILFITIMERDNKLRTYSLSTLLGLAIVYTSWRIFYNEEKKTNDIIEYVITMIAVFYCYQSRIIEIIAVGILIILVLWKKKGEKSHTLAIVIIICMLIVFFQSGYFDRIISSFQIGGAYSGSTNTRLGEIEYYWNAFKDSPLFGLGLVGIDTLIGQQYHENFGEYTMADIGYLGALANMGISFFIPFGLFLISFIKTIQPINKVKVLDKGNIKMGLVEAMMFGRIMFIYVLLSSTLQIITDRQRMLILPCLMAFSEYIKLNLGNIVKSRKMSNSFRVKEE